MNTNFESKLKNLPSDHRPDVFTLSLNRQEHSLPPPDNFIISRNLDGSVLSRYIDDTWDVSPYHRSSGKCRLHFIINKTERLPEDYIRQMKWLMICLMYLSPLALSTSSVFSLLGTIRNLIVYCHEMNIPHSSCILSEYSALRKYLSDTKPSVKHIVSLLQIMFHLSKIGQNLTGIPIVNDLKFVELCAQVQKTRIEQIAQTLPIPSRIYLMRIEQLDSFLYDFVAHKQGILSLLQACFSNNQYGVAKSVQRNRGRSTSHRRSARTGNPCAPCLPDFAEALAEHKLSNFAKKHGFHSRQSFSSFLTKVRYVCKHQIHLFSGMRHDEVKLLQFGCLARESMSWGEAIFLTGITTKTSRSRKNVRWVTCKAVEPAIDLAESITKVVADYFGYAPNECSLFIPHSFLNQKKFTPEPQDCITFELTQYNPTSTLIEESDIAEIERVVLSIDWKKYPMVKVGEPWQFKFHQYRRSLTVYGSNSGLIELPSLKYQLKHITDSMTMYYCQGSQRSIDILGDLHSEHFIHAYQLRKPITDAIVYIRDYLMSDEPLSGGQGIILKRARAGKDNTIIAEERELTERRFKNGEISFKETPLGACTNTEKCDARLNIAFTSCITCAHAILKPSSVNTFISEIKTSMNNLPIDTVEYRLEKAQLDDLQRLQTKMLLTSEEDSAC